MIQLTDEQLLTLNKAGLIPGPGETAEQFSARADYCLQLRSRFPQEWKESLDREENNPFETTPLTTTVEEYQLAPSWVPLFYSNYRLPIWQGGCAWIYQMTEQTPTAGFIQLRRCFKQSDRYLRIYDKDELVRHELSHVGRMLFQEPRFEEILAYRTSRSPLRRWVGPLIQSSTESVLFVLLLFILIVVDLFLVSMDRPEAYIAALWLKAIPIALLVAALWRLSRKQRQLKHCLERLRTVIDPPSAEAVLFRLTDKEIEQFATMDRNAIVDYVQKHALKELRWRVIAQAYFR